MNKMNFGRGPVAWMAKNSVASNLLMLLLVLAGVFSMLQIKQEIFPDFALDFVTISVPYPGAGPAEVEQGVVLVVEEAITGIEGIKTISSTALEGNGVVTAELLGDANAEKVVADIKNAVDRIASFPEDSETPTVALATRRREVIGLIIAGDQDLATLHDLGEKVRTDLIDSPQITQVDLEGLPELEISIEIPREQLESLNITLDEVATQIARASLELPGGEIKTEGGQILVRLADRRLTGHEFGGIIVRGTSSGAAVRLADIATIRDGYADTYEALYFDGRPAVLVAVYRVGDETPTAVAKVVNQYAEKLRGTLPENVSVATWNDWSIRLENRINLLLRNAVFGLVLVIVILGLFLKARLAFWVSLGIPICYLGSFIVLKLFGMSINVISVFGFIIALGMVVDDAIVVSENTFHKMQMGQPRLRAAIEGARQMTVPVVFSVLTTIAAFTPLLFIPGTMGKVFYSIPVVVISVFVLSLIESFFILPAHLGHGAEDRPPPRGFRWLERARVKVSGGLEQFSARIYVPALRAVLRRRGLFIAGSSAVLIMTIGLVASGLLPFNFFPDVEDDEIEVIAQMPFGTPIETTIQVQRNLERAARKAIAELDASHGVQGLLTELGKGARTHGGTEGGSHLVSLEMALVPPDERKFTTTELATLWKKHVEPIPGLQSLIFKVTAGPGAGAAVDVQLTHTDYDVLEKASTTLADAMLGYPQLTDVENSFTAGKAQLDFHLLPFARSLGLTGNDVARQLRAAFYGAEAIREQRGRNEIRVMVRLPEAQRESEFDLEQFKIRTPDGGLAPLSYVAQFDRGRAPTVIRRENGKRIVNVNAKLAPGAPSPRPILQALSENELGTLRETFPELRAEFVGRQREQSDTFANLAGSLALALFVIFGLLAVPLRSYTQPAVIMMAIPFGFVGAVAGHLMMGQVLSLISVMGIIALSGVVVNDTLVLNVAATDYRREGMSAEEAIVAAGTRRLRPIILTSLTTFFGLAPMIFETAVSAQMMIPMAISLGFGILFSLPVALLLVPAFYVTVDNLVKRLGHSAGLAPTTYADLDETE